MRDRDLLQTVPTYTKNFVIVPRYITLRHCSFHFTAETLETKEFPAPVRRLQGSVHGILPLKWGSVGLTSRPLTLAWDFPNYDGRILAGDLLPEGGMTVGELLEGAVPKDYVGQFIPNELFGNLLAVSISKLEVKFDQGNQYAVGHMFREVAATISVKKHIKIYGKLALTDFALTLRVMHPLSPQMRHLAGLVHTKFTIGKVCSGK